MPIIVNLDVMMARRKMSLNELSEKVDITLSNLSVLKTGKAKAIRFSTLEVICKVLNCQPGDILEFVEWWIAGNGDWGILKYSCFQYVFKSNQRAIFTIHPLKSTLMKYDKPITI